MVPLYQIMAFQVSTTCCDIWTWTQVGWYKEWKRKEHGMSRRACEPRAQQLGRLERRGGRRDAAVAAVAGAPAALRKRYSQVRGHRGSVTYARQSTSTGAPG